MADPHIRAAFYLSPTLDALWRWTPDGEVLTWPDDTTIAFGAEVEEVLKRLAPGGLPPFGAVALVLAACREGWMQSLGRETVAGYVHAISGTHALKEDGPHRASEVVYGLVIRHMNAVLDGLDAVSRLPRHQIDSISAKALLADVVFETAKNRSSPEDAALVIQALDEGIDPQTLRPQLSSEESLAHFIRQVDGLCEGLKHVDSEALRLRARTGLDQPVDPAPDELAPPDAVRALLAELATDPELAGLARLAQDLMAAVSVARSLRSREELSVGGVSDLSNRGPLDRLLVSELAHDDLTLAVRIAVNEALYLRRESPPREPPHRRKILIDAGIRMWGVPRVFATAVALALAATSDPKVEFAVFRAARSGIEPVDLTRRAGIEAHLAVLETSPHPGAALEAFLSEAADDNSGQTDAVLVTHADVLADPEFSAALSASGTTAMYLATVDREGSFSLLVHSRAGRKLVREAKLSLDTIYGRASTSKQRPAGVPLIAREKNPALPAIVYCDPFPFFLPCSVEPRLAAVSPKHGLVAAARDGRLLQWRDMKHGARQISALLPVGVIRGVFIDDETAFAVVTHRRDPLAYLISANLPTGHCAHTELALPQLGQPLGLFVHRMLLYFVYKNRIDAFSMSDGKPAATVRLVNGIKWHRGRVFRRHRDYCTVSYDGSKTLSMVQIPAIRRYAVDVFEREGIEGFWSVCAPKWLVVDPNQIEHDVLPSPKPPVSSLLGVSRDGNRLVFGAAGANVVVDLKRRTNLVYVSNVAETLLEPQMFWSTRSQAHPRPGFTGIFVDERSRLSLWSKRKGAFSFDLDKEGELSLSASSISKADGDFQMCVQKFDRMERAPGMRFAMGAAKWRDGSIAWLDHRGMLHLRSSDHLLPEMSITLTNLKPAAWATNGQVTGPAFLLGDLPTVEGWHFDELLRQFVARLR